MKALLLDRFLFYLRVNLIREKRVVFYFTISLLFSIETISVECIWFYWACFPYNNLLKWLENKNWGLLLPYPKDFSVNFFCCLFVKTSFWITLQIWYYFISSGVVLSLRIAYDSELQVNKQKPPPPPWTTKNNEGQGVIFINAIKSSEVAKDLRDYLRLFKSSQMKKLSSRVGSWPAKSHTVRWGHSQS